MSDDIDPVDAALAAVEKQEAAEYAERLNAKLDELDNHVTMLRAMGVEVQIVLHLSDRDEARNSLEIGPADARASMSIGFSM